MISLSTASQLKKAGLTWIPALHDFFAIPDRGLDDRVFVISDMMAYVEIRNNYGFIAASGKRGAADFELIERGAWVYLPDPVEEKIVIV
ncbi:MAG: hypothetical protein P8Y14_19385 [Anaerolineales bacterium]